MKNFFYAATLVSSLAMGLVSQEAAAACRGAWTEGTTYSTGDGVTYNGGNYGALVGHTACVGCGWNPVAAPSLWQAGTGGCGGSGDGGNNPPNPPNPPTGNGIAGILSESTFNAMFPGRNGFYTYSALVAAANSFSGFATTGTTETRKREVAAFLANIAHETGNLVYIEEIAKSTMCDTSWGPPGCGCAAGKMYYGRGPIQLSWNGNYCAAGNALGVDLKNNPDLVARDATISWRTGFWFWMTQTGAGSMTGHNAIVNGAGFGETIRTINGALECGGRNPAQVQSRVNNYTRFCSLLGVSPGANTGC
ncbi:chitinase [Melittangium boletus DSM 14713]|uniref:Chitinase n=1 Tax=Melittangium boletus DSM 14713 TaxID=1294270 RepID=A0A250I8X2_9BACT|nr:glycoside hydrolase family 19 protein [Melittangium boletus]ATB27621.1 chitinase [Melittangium boletus DSM 14713]